MPGMMDYEDGEMSPEMYEEMMMMEMSLLFEREAYLECSLPVVSYLSAHACRPLPFRRAGLAPVRVIMPSSPAPR